MKAILEFELPDDKESFGAAARGTDWAFVVWDLDQQLRTWIKHGHKFDNPVHALEGAREQLNEMLIDRGLQIPE